jgi:hypothetical protein
MMVDGGSVPATSPIRLIAAMLTWRARLRARIKGRFAYLSATFPAKRQGAGAQSVQTRWCWPGEVRPQRSARATRLMSAVDRLSSAVLARLPVRWWRSNRNRFWRQAARSAGDRSGNVTVAMGLTEGWLVGAATMPSSTASRSSRRRYVANSRRRQLVSQDASAGKAMLYRAFGR